jgi:hypothetical protein
VSIVVVVVSFVPEPWLNGTHVGTALEQGGGEGMTKGMGADVLRQTGTANRHLAGLVDGAGVNMRATGEHADRRRNSGQARQTARPMPWRHVETSEPEAGAGTPRHALEPNPAEAMS